MFGRQMAAEPATMRVMNQVTGRRHQGELYAALAAMGFGSTYVATAFALRGFDPLPAVAWRSLLAAIVLGLVIGAWHGRASSAPAGRGAGVVARAPRLLVLAVLGGPLFMSAMNLAVAHVGATITAFVAGLYAVLSAVVAPALLPERLTPRVLLGFLLALAGTAMLAELDPTLADAAGIAWGLLAAISYALFLVLARRWSAAYRLDPLAITFSNTAVATVAIGGLVALTDPASLLPASVPVEALIAVGWLAAIAAIGQILVVASVRLIAAPRSAAFLLLNPVTATILAALLLGERPSSLQIVGGALVLLGMAAATLPVNVRLLSGARAS